MIIGTKRLPLALPSSRSLAHGILIDPRTGIVGVRRHHILLVGPLIDVHGPLLNAALLESLGLLFEPLRVLLVGLYQLYFFL